MSEQVICGLPYTVKQPIKPKHSARGIMGHKAHPKPRYLVAGVNHKKGQPIRFKSLENAERHITNLKLGKG